MNSLELRIREAATWILHINPQFEHNYFRTEQISPIIKIKIARDFSAECLTAVNQVAAKRRAALESAAVPLITLDDALAYGKLIYTCPSDSTLDGSAGYYSQGLVDIWEVPAWDTWVTFGNLEYNEFEAYKNCIISWIPESVYDLFYSGQEAGLENNLGWIAQLPANMNLASNAITFRELIFVEIADRQLIESRLSRINQNAVVEEAAVTDTNRTTAQVTLANSSFWDKIKQFFS